MAHFEDNLDLPLREILPLIQRRLCRHTQYFGVPAVKFPGDAWIYQEIIHETQPDVIVEIGNLHGGGLLYLAHLCDLMDRGRVIGVDVSHAAIPEIVRHHPRITLIEGDACDHFKDVDREVGAEKALVIEDSNHTCANTLAVLRTYSVLIHPGDYLIVEDGIIGHGLPMKKDPGPWTAVEMFLEENPNFEIDRSREAFLITWNPKGFLRRT